MMTTTIRINEEIYDRLRQFAFNRRWSINFAIGVAINEFLASLAEESDKSEGR